MNTSRAPELALFPLTAEVNNQGHLLIGGCDVVDLAEEFGMPLYFFNVIDRPAIIMAKAGQAHLIRRRVTYQDLMSLDLI